MAESRALRSPLTIMLTVWKALFIRETLSRIAQDRLAVVWMVLEPLAHIAVLMWFFTAGIRTRVVAGADTGVFIMLGILAFFLPRNILTRGMDAIGSNERLYAFRQIKPVDTVFMRAVSEAVLICIIFLIIFAAAGLLGHPVIPADPLGAMGSLGALWLLGLGLGLIFSVLGNLVPEFGRLVRLIITPFYFLSAVIMPSIKMPVFIREILLYNPVLHGIESLRIAFMPTYQIPPGIDVHYVVMCGVAFILAGLVLQVRYRDRLMTTL